MDFLVRHLDKSFERASSRTTAEIIPSRSRPRRLASLSGPNFPNAHMALRRDCSKLCKQTAVLVWHDEEHVQDV